MPYLIPARGRRMGIVPMMVDGGGPGGSTIIRYPMPIRTGPIFPGPPIVSPLGPIDVNPTPPLLPPGGGSVTPIIVGPIVSAPDLPVFAPVPAGFPKNQIFVNSDGSFWQWSTSQNAWMNVGTPYGTGAGATPAAPPPSPTGGSTAVPGTVAPAPVNVSVAAPSSGYSDIFNWLQTDSLASSIGFSGIPNWIIAAGGGLLAYKAMGKK